MAHTENLYSNKLGILFLDTYDLQTLKQRDTNNLK